MIVERWKRLGEHLITKYNDGYVQNEKGRPEEKGYPDDWIQRVIGTRPDQFKLETWGDAASQKELLD
jgi:hypothetical protein